jgi:glycosyltransferase involved in cell wall biosynthesis
MRPLQPVPELRNGHRYLAVYLGIMGPQDGVDQALRAFAEVVHTYGRSDCQFALLGFGDCLADLQALAAELKLEEHVTFTGRVGREEIADYLSTADLGICPDPKSPLNDVSTMNKTMEYMAYCVPIVSFDLVETRVSAAESAIYLPSGDIDGFARAWIGLIDDRDERVRRGLLARERVVSELDWAPQAARYAGVWRAVLGLDATVLSPSQPVLSAAIADGRGRPYLDLDDRAALEAFVGDRGRADGSPAAGDGGAGPEA